jgi:hypothetical protein
MNSGDMGNRELMLRTLEEEYGLVLKMAKRIVEKFIESVGIPGGAACLREGADEAIWHIADHLMSTMDSIAGMLIVANADQIQRATESHVENVAILKKIAIEMEKKSDDPVS